MNTVAETILIAFGLIGTFFFGYSLGVIETTKTLVSWISASISDKEKKDKNETE